jgi:hypothetical protein
MAEEDVIKCAKSAYEKKYPNIGCAHLKRDAILSQFCDEEHCPKSEQSDGINNAVRCQSILRAAGEHDPWPSDTLAVAKQLDYDGAKQLLKRVIHF